MMFFLNLKYLLIYGVIVKLTIMSFLILSKTSVVIAYYTGSICLYIFVAFISIFCCLLSFHPVSFLLNTPF